MHRMASSLISTLSSLPLLELAKASRFIQRLPKKLSLETFLQSLLVSVGQPAYSFRTLALQISSLQKQSLSKQALHRRCNARLIDFLQLLLSFCLGQRISSCAPCSLWQAFGRVLIVYFPQKNGHGKY
jgi:hypothetical protein